MEFEIHLTVKTPRDIEEFKSTCMDLGVKPIIIETERKGEFGQQVMTSSKYSAPHYQDALNHIYFGLLQKKYLILRQKVEIFPQTDKHVAFKYYESHLRLKLPKGFDRTNLLKICDLNHFHLSKNLLKSDELFDYQMITYRNSKISYVNFCKMINEMTSCLENNRIEYDKVEIEECIFDNNITIDKSWLNG